MLLLLLLLPLLAPAKVYTRGLSYGASGQELFLYTFMVYENVSDSQTTVPTAPIYVFQWSNGTEVAGQHHVIDVKPGDAGYSDLWQVYVVTVNDSYAPDSIKSFQGIGDAGYTATPASPKKLVNCPVVNAGDVLEAPNDAPLIHGWYKGVDVVYFDFGPASDVLMPLYHVVDSMNNFIQPGNTNISLGSVAPYFYPFWKISFNSTTLTKFPVKTQADTAAQSWTYKMIVVNCPVSYISPDVGVDYPLIDGWYQDKPIWYYDFGPLNTTTVTTSPIYRMVYANGTQVGNNVIATTVGVAGYSPLWDVYLVTVNDTYVANTLSSLARITSSGYPINRANKLVNCPVAPAGSTLATVAGIQWAGASVWGWYNDMPAFYFDFGVAPQSSIPIYVLTKNGAKYGNNVVDAVPTDASYSPFWQVLTHELGNDSYVANSITNAKDLTAKFTFAPVSPNEIRNCPIAKVGTGNAASGKFSSVAMSLALVCAAVYALL